MTTLPLDELAHVDAVNWERRIGKSNYWVEVTREDLGQTKAWRLGILQKPPRASKTKPPQHLIRFSSQNPLFTVIIDGQRYPLMIEKAVAARGGKITVGGSRKIGSSSSSIITWVGDIEAGEEGGAAYVRISGRFRLPGNRKKTAEIVARVPLVIYLPVVVDNPFPESANVAAAVIWSEHTGSTIGFTARGAESSPITLVDGALQTTVKNIDLRGRVPQQFVLALSSSASEREALQLIRSEAAESAEQELPKINDSNVSLLEVAGRGIEHLLDSKNCTPVGKERWYFRASGEFDFGPGYPFYSIEADPVLLRWNRFYASEISERIARLTARGVAADFAVIVGESGAEGNKGALWDCAAGVPEQLAFSTVDKKNEYGIASNARMAHALLTMFTESKDPLFRQAGLNAVNWLILKQNSSAYYDGPYISARTGKFTEQRRNFDGILAIRSLVSGFRASGNEVFIKNAWKIAKYAKANLLSHGLAPCLYGKESETSCPVTLSHVVHALMDLDAEAPNEELRKTIALVANAFSLCQFSEKGHQCLNYDDAESGALECASAALRLFAFYKKDRWFRLGYTLIKKAANKEIINWRLADSSIELLLSLGCLVPGVAVDFAKIQLTAAWFKYLPDSAAAAYFDIRNSHHKPVDFLPLVCRENNQTIILLTAPSAGSGLRLTKRNLSSNARIPIVDLVTNAPCTVDLPLHPLPNNLGQFAVVRVDP